MIKRFKNVLNIFKKRLKPIISSILLKRFHDRSLFYSKIYLYP